MWERRTVLDKEDKPFFVGVRDGKMIDWSIRFVRPDAALPIKEYSRRYLKELHS